MIDTMPRPRPPGLQRETLTGRMAEDGEGKMTVEKQTDALLAEIAKLREVNSDMLDALKEAVARADETLPKFDGRTPECQAVYDKCVSAIAKAELTRSKGSGIVMASPHQRRIPENDMRQRLADACAAAGSQKHWAAGHGLSVQFVCDVLNGRRSVTDKVADALGYRRVVLFERKPT